MILYDYNEEILSSMLQYPRLITTIQDGFKYEQARLIEEKVMLPKFKIISFAIVCLSCIFFVPNSHANYKVTHTPGETVGVVSTAPIQCGRSYNLQGGKRA